MFGMSSGRLRSVCALLISCAACHGERLETAGAEWSASPAAVDFGEIYVGASASRAIMISSEGRAPCRISLTLSGPFSISDTVVDLESGRVHQVAVRFEPISSGPAEGAAALAGCGQTERVELRGASLPPLECGAPRECATFSFDPDAGRCQRVPLSEGEPCSDSCLIDSTCVDGSCVGLVRSCADEDPCTVDACGANGCLNIPVGQLCGRFPGCEPNAQPRTVSAWQYHTDRRRWWEPLLIDAEGNHYWLEEDPAPPYGMELVSFSESGIERYRTPFDAAGAAPKLTLVRERVVVARGNGRWIDVFEQRDGAHSLRLDVRAMLGLPPDRSVWVGRGVPDRGSSEEMTAVTFPVSVASSHNHFDKALLVSIALWEHPPKVRWKRALEDDFHSVSATRDNHWLVMHGGVARAFLPGGDPLWARTASGGELITAGDLVYTREGAFRVDTGQTVFMFASSGSTPLLAGAALGLRATADGRLEVFDSLTGLPLRTLPAAPWSPALLMSDSILLVEGTTRTVLASDGAADVLDCELADLDGQPMSIALVRERLLVLSNAADGSSTTLRSYATPGLTLANEGWVVPHGNPRLDNRPLP
jgi:hypothetical protein